MRVPAGARSGRCSLAGVLGNALPAPSTMPLPLPSLPSNAGSAIAARMPLPPLRPRSSPLPGASTSGSASASHCAKVRICALRQPARLGRPRRRPFARPRHELLDPQHVRGDERRVQRADPFQLGRQRPGQQHVGAGQQRQVQIRLLGDLGAQRIDHHQPAALALRPADAAHQMQIGDRRVVAPDDVQLARARRTPAGSRARRHRSRPTPRCARRRTSTADTAGWRPADGRTAATCCRRRASRAGRHSSAASPPAAPTGRSPR